MFLCFYNTEQETQTSLQWNVFFIVFGRLLEFQVTEIAFTIAFEVELHVGGQQGGLLEYCCYIIGSFLFYQ